MDFTEQESRLAARVVNRSESYRQMAIGAEVSHAWLIKWMNGQVPNPGIRTLQKLADYLEENQ